MGPETLDRNYSQNILLRMLVLGLVAGGLVWWQLDFLRELYFHYQLPTVGWLVNGAILVLFVIGLARVVQVLLRTAREEAALARFVNNLRRSDSEPDMGLDPKSLIARRYTELERARQKGYTVDHHALAATLVAELSTQTSLPRFVHNVLILTGVFGTIVSLSIALVGASDIMDSAGATGGIGTVIQGMSTALSTTMTAIASYFFFGYFYLKVMDAQTRLAGRIEHITATRLMPRLTPSADSIAGRFANMMHNTEKLVRQLRDSGERLAAGNQDMGTSLAAYRQEFAQLNTGLTDIQELLKRGFRLPSDR